jgi:hypothetical protein
MAIGVCETSNAGLLVNLTTKNSSCHHLIVDTRTESVAVAADFAALSTINGIRNWGGHLIHTQFPPGYSQPFVLSPVGTTMFVVTK